MSDPTSYDYFKGKKPDKTYVSKTITNKNMDGSDTKIRIVSKVIDTPLFCDFIKEKESLVLRVTTNERQAIVVKVLEDSKGIFILSLQRYTIKNGNPHEVSFSFIGDEIGILKEFIDSIKYIDFSESGKAKIDDSQIQEIRTLLSKKENINLLIEALQNNITEQDIVSLGYRKEQLEIFKKLLTNDIFFNSKKTEWKKSKNEDVWQCFFEMNAWIFGYGLNFIFQGPLEGKKLEQVVKGFGIDGPGKRTDGLLKSRGIINSLGLVEIKTHKTPLLKQIADAYRPAVWQLSDELNGGIAQIQKTAQISIQNLGTKLSPKNQDGSPTGEEIFIYQPKTYLVIGNLNEFKTAYGINEDKLSSFELFRKNIQNPDVITFDELYERAKFIIYNNKNDMKKEGI